MKNLNSKLPWARPIVSCMQLVRSRSKFREVPEGLGMKRQADEIDIGSADSPVSIDRAFQVQRLNIRR